MFLSFLHFCIKWLTICGAYYTHRHMASPSLEEKLREFRYSVGTAALPWATVISTPLNTQAAPDLKAMKTLLSSLACTQVSLEGLQSVPVTHVVHLFQVLQLSLQFALWSQNILHTTSLQERKQLRESVEKAHRALQRQSETQCDSERAARHLLQQERGEREEATRRCEELEGILDGADAAVMSLREELHIERKAGRERERRMERLEEDVSALRHALSRAEAEKRKLQDATQGMYAGAANGCRCGGCCSHSPAAPVTLYMPPPPAPAPFQGYHGCQCGGAPQRHRRHRHHHHKKRAPSWSSSSSSESDSELPSSATPSPKIKRKHRLQRKQEVKPSRQTLEVEEEEEEAVPQRPSGWGRPTGTAAVAVAEKAKIHPLKSNAELRPFTASRHQDVAAAATPELPTRSRVQQRAAEKAEEAPASTPTVRVVTSEPPLAGAADSSSVGTPPFDSPNTRNVIAEMKRSILPSRSSLASKPTLAEDVRFQSKPSEAVSRKPPAFELPPPPPMSKRVPTESAMGTPENSHQTSSPFVASTPKGLPANAGNPSVPPLLTMSKPSLINQKAKLSVSSTSTTQPSTISAPPPPPPPPPSSVPTGPSLVASERPNSVETTAPPLPTPVNLTNNKEMASPPASARSDGKDASSLSGSKKKKPLPNFSAADLLVSPKKRSAAPSSNNSSAVTAAAAATAAASSSNQDPPVDRRAMSPPQPKPQLKPRPTKTVLSTPPPKVVVPVLKSSPVIAPEDEVPLPPPPVNPYISLDDMPASVAVRKGSEGATESQGGLISSPKTNGSTFSLPTAKPSASVTLDRTAGSAAGGASRDLSLSDRKLSFEAVTAAAVQAATGSPVLANSFLSQFSDRKPSRELSSESGKSRSPPSNPTTVVCRHCREEIPRVGRHIHESNCDQRQVKCPQCGEAVLAKSLPDHVCSSTKPAKVASPQPIKKAADPPPVKNAAAASNNGSARNGSSDARASSILLQETQRELQALLEEEAAMEEMKSRTR